MLTKELFEYGANNKNWIANMKNKNIIKNAVYLAWKNQCFIWEINLKGSWNIFEKYSFDLNLFPLNIKKIAKN